MPITHTGDVHPKILAHTLWDEGSRQNLGRQDSHEEIRNHKNDGMAYSGGGAGKVLLEAHEKSGLTVRW